MKIGDIDCCNGKFSKTITLGRYDTNKKFIGKLGKGDINVNVKAVVQNASASMFSISMYSGGLTKTVSGGNVMRKEPYPKKPRR